MITALKYNSPQKTHYVVCNIDDPDAVRWVIGHHVNPIEFDTRSQAERVAHALIRAHADGRKAAFDDLRRFIGVKE
jgi:hypothetical protein